MVCDWALGVASVLCDVGFEPAVEALGVAAGLREAVECWLLALAGRLGRPSICDLEVGYAARNAEEWDRLMGALHAFEAVETSAAHVTRALQVQRLLAARSQRGRKLPDLLVELPRVGTARPARWESQVVGIDLPDIVTHKSSIHPANKRCNPPVHGEWPSNNAP